MCAESGERREEELFWKSFLRDSYLTRIGPCGFCHECLGALPRATWLHDPASSFGLYHISPLSHQVKHSAFDVHVEFGQWQTDFP
jgi:hypothetical protein